MTQRIDPTLRLQGPAGEGRGEEIAGEGRGASRGGSKQVSNGCRGYKRPPCTHSECRKRTWQLQLKRLARRLLGLCLPRTAWERKSQTGHFQLRLADTAQILECCGLGNPPSYSQESFIAEYCRDLLLGCHAAVMGVEGNFPASSLAVFSGTND